MPDAAIQSATKKARRSASQALAGTASAASAAPASAALVSDLARKRLRDDYIAGLGQGSYSFNPPTPIKVGLPITVALWVDTRKQAAQLAETMKKAYPHSASQVESGTTVWSPKMKAILTGENDITIKPVDGEPFDGIKDVFENSPAKWEWAVTPHSLEPKNLHLKLFVILPPELGGSQDFLVLEREIKVEYRVWWIIDHYWEKYWKWMIGGLASALAASFAWWWKNRQGKS